jgi:hypothetical protein
MLQVLIVLAVTAVWQQRNHKARSFSMDAERWCDAADVLLVILLLALISVAVRQLLQLAADHAAAVPAATELVQAVALPAVVAQSDCAHYCSSLIVSLPVLRWTVLP